MPKLSTRDLEAAIEGASAYEEESAAHRAAERAGVLRAFGRAPEPVVSRPSVAGTVSRMRSALRHPALGLSAASLLLLCGALAFWSSVAGPAPLVYAELIEPLMRAQSGRFDAVVRVNGEEKMRQESYFAGDLVRLNIEKEDRSYSQVMDISKDLALDLDHTQKRAVLRRVGAWMSDEQRREEKRVIAKYGGGFLGGFRAALDPEMHKRAPEGVAHEPVEKTLPGGVKVRGFRGTRAEDDGYVEVWADPATGEVAEFVMRVPTWPEGQESVLTNFDFDKPVDPALLSMTPPEGYEFVDETKKPASLLDTDEEG